MLGRAGALDDEDILASDAVADLDAGLPDAELGEVDFGWRNAQVCADLLRELRVGGAREEEDIANHDCWCSRSLCREVKGVR